MPIRINHNHQLHHDQQQYNSHTQYYKSLQNGQQQQQQNKYQDQVVYDDNEQQQYSSHISRQQLMMLQTIKLQLIENNIITSQQLQKLLHNNSNTTDGDGDMIINNNSSSCRQQMFTIITHLAATVIQQNEHMEQIQNAHRRQIISMQQTIQTSRQLIDVNDQRVITALQLLSQLTQQLLSFTRFVYSDNRTSSTRLSTRGIVNRSISTSIKLPLQIYKYFRHVYEFTQELLNIFNQYQFTGEEFVRRRAEIIEEQIKIMEEIMLAEAQEQRIQQEEDDQQPQQQSLQYNINHPHPNNLSLQTQNYILSLRQQINQLHQTLTKNDQQFTQQIQKYNTTIKQLSETIKCYEKEIGKMIHYELRIEQLEKKMVIFRQDRYKNEIIIDNMAKRIRNYEKELKGVHAFISPHRQRLVSSPESRFSALTPKQFILNSLSNIKTMNNSTEQYKQRQRGQQQKVPRLNIGALNINR